MCRGAKYVSRKYVLKKAWFSQAYVKSQMCNTQFFPFEFETCHSRFVFGRSPVSMFLTSLASTSQH